MTKSELTKSVIMQKTIQLILETEGNIEDITIRKIAQRAGIGIGLVNHYFHSKEDLIEQCVQSIISEVVYSFRPEVCESRDPLEITKCVAKQVMDFLMEHRQISRVSILGDMKSPGDADNTMGTVAGFGRCLSGNKKEGDDLDSFMITAVLQVAFLRKDLLQKTLGINFYHKGERDSFIEQLIDKVAGKSKYD